MREVKKEGGGEQFGKFLYENFMVKGGEEGEVFQFRFGKFARQAEFIGFPVVMEAFKV